MRYILHKENDKWWICLEGQAEFIHGEYTPSLLIQHELIMDFNWFDGEGSYVMDDDLVAIPEGSKLRETAEIYPDPDVKVKFREEIYDKIQRNHDLDETLFYDYSIPE